MLHDDNSTDKLRIALAQSHLAFTRYFYEHVNGSPFLISNPHNREPHPVTIAKALTRVAKGDVKRLLIMIPPGHFKTTMVMSYMAWQWIRAPHAKFIYCSYAKDLAEKATYEAKKIITSSDYQRLFNVQLDASFKAKDHFKTVQGGTIYGVGVEGAVTGYHAGVAEGHEGALIIDDILKASDAASETMREKANNYFFSTLLNRRMAGDNTPIIVIAQRLFEGDLMDLLKNRADGYEWEVVEIPALDAHDIAIDSRVIDQRALRIMRETRPDEFWAQYQQQPQPAGGTLFKREYFTLIDTPEIITTAITVDTAETDKMYNDATVFNFWGLYKIKINGVDTGVYAVHSIDLDEIWVEPKDLKQAFFDFWQRCMRFHMKPHYVYIEKKSTGVTLQSVLSELPGMAIIPLNRTKSKNERFGEIQPYFASKQLTFERGAPHVDKCIEHLTKITRNGTHARDDIADTFADAIRIGLIDKSLTNDDNDEQFNAIISDILTTQRNYGKSPFQNSSRRLTQNQRMY